MSPSARNYLLRAGVLSPASHRETLVFPQRSLRLSTAAAIATVLAIAGCSRQEGMTPAEPDARAPQTPAGMPARGTRSPDPAAMVAGTADPELARQWASLSERMPLMLTTIEGRVGNAPPSANAPPSGDAAQGMDRQTLVKAQAGLENLRSTWFSALSDYNSGDVAGAVQKGNVARETAEELLALLGLPGGETGAAADQP
jgi:hypothetical protein